MNAPVNIQNTPHAEGCERRRSARLPGSRTLSALADPLFHRLIDRLDQAFDHGSITGHLPDGRTRVVGGRGAGLAAEMVITRWRALLRLMVSGSVGWFRAWMAGEWSSDDPVAVFAAFSANRRTLARSGRARGPIRMAQRLLHWLHRNNPRGSRRNIHAHYDLGNDFYAAWLDPSMTYSSARFDGTAADESLETAQMRKVDAALDRLNLAPGQRLLEIGCGWGALARRAIERFDVDYTGLTLSAEQAAWAGQQLAGRGDIVLRDYRDERGSYDAIVSIEMVEAVGHAYWPAYLDCIAARLKPGGRAAIQYIAIDDAIFDRYAAGADFIQTYIFPGGCLLSVERFKALAEARGLAWSAQVDFAADYAETLLHWRTAFDDAVMDNNLPSQFDSKFIELWRYYLMYCEGGFRGGGITVAQVTLIRE